MARDDSQAGIDQEEDLRPSVKRRETALGKTSNNSDAADMEGDVEALLRVAKTWADGSADASVFQTVIQHMQEAVILIDRNFRVLAINDPALSGLGVSAGKPTPDIYSDAVSVSDGASLHFENSIAARCLRGERVENEKHEYPLSDGSTRYMLANGTPILGPGGKVEMALIVVRDITKIAAFQAQTEKMLAEARRQRASLRQILNHMPTGVILLDSDLKILAANRTYLHYFGESELWRDGVRIDEILPRAEESGIISLLRQALDTNQPVSVRNFRYDGFTQGTTYWSGSAVPMQLQHGRNSRQGLALAVVDVTEEVCAHSRLSELASLAERRAAEIEAQNARLNTILEATPVPLFVYDKGWSLISYNSAALKLLKGMGLTQWLTQSGNAREIMGLDALTVEGETIAPQNLPLSRSLSGKTCRDVTIRYQRGPNLVGVYSVNCAPLRDAHGRVTGAVQAISDITEQALAQEQNRESYRREHAVADKLQQCFLPDDLPQMEGFTITARYHPALDEAFVGGDFYDVFPIENGKFGIVIGDVAGKGLKSAVYTAMTKYTLRAYALEDSAPESVLARLNEALTVCTPCEVFITLVYGVLDAGGRKFVYANAGHEQPMLYMSESHSATLLDVTGRALALVSGSSYKTRTVDFCDGDILLLYTDGITDAGWGADRLGHESVLRALASNAMQPVSELADSIRTVALDFAGGKLGDDAAMLLLKAHEGEQGI